MIKNTVVVASVSARTYVQSLHEAGYEVIAIDCFKDKEIQIVAKKSYCLTLSNGCFDAATFNQTLSQIDWQPVIGFVYGSGFDGAPDLLDTVAQQTTLLGNTSAVCKKLKSIPEFFDLMQRLGVVYPDVSYQALPNADDWLEKRIGGAGGMHICPAVSGKVPADGCYYQRKIDGMSISALFLADGSRAQVIGFNKLYIDGDAQTPYRFGGAISNISLPKTVQNQLIDYVNVITQAVGLRGLNSIDAMLLDNMLYVLEINPRLSATIGLYESLFEDKRQNILEWHIAAVAGKMPEVSVSKHSKIQRIVYAEQALDISDIPWPAWVSDTPMAGSKIEIGEPLCSVLAEADTVESAEHIMTTRQESLKQLIYK